MKGSKYPWNYPWNHFDILGYWLQPVALCGCAYLLVISMIDQVWSWTENWQNFFLKILTELDSLIVRSRSSHSVKQFGPKPDLKPNVIARTFLIAVRLRRSTYLRNVLGHNSQCIHIWTRFSLSLAVQRKWEVSITISTNWVGIIKEKETEAINVK